MPSTQLQYLQIALFFLFSVCVYLIAVPTSTKSTKENRKNLQNLHLQSRSYKQAYQRLLALSAEKFAAILLAITYHFIRFEYISIWLSCSKEMKKVSNNEKVEHKSGPEWNISSLAQNGNWLLEGWIAHLNTWSNHSILWFCSFTSLTCLSSENGTMNKSKLFNNSPRHTDRSILFKMDKHVHIL